MYTNKSASNLNLNLYSKLVGGSKCIKYCKKKCKDKCRGVCKASYNDTQEHDNEYSKLEKKLSELIKKLEDIKASRLKKLQTILNPATRYKYDPRYPRYDPRYPRYGGRTRKNRRKRGGFNFFGNTSNLSECENGCNTNCSENCTLLCENAVSNTSTHKEKVDALKSQIKLHEQLIETIQSKPYN